MPLTHTIGQSFIELQTADSTNNYAMDAAKDGHGQHGMAWYTDNQTAGRGQRGHSWENIPGQNMALSVLLDTSVLEIENQFAIIMLGALATYDLLKPYGKENLKIKWPNDLYINDKKAVGILTESIIKGQSWQWTVIGIGINVNQSKFDPAIQSKATSLKLVTDKEFSPKQLAIELCLHLELRWQQLREYGATKLLSDYNECLYKQGASVTFRPRDSNDFMAGIIKQANGDGTLTITTEDGRHLFLNYGAVEFFFQH